ncbi:hypothetical protein J6590_012924 [Homalodisca vitripennis]|nr:hypothetical protein J6590_012924 [Homalodisca vitripennis]
MSPTLSDPRLHLEVVQLLPKQSHDKFYCCRCENCVRRFAPPRGVLCLPPFACPGRLETACTALVTSPLETAAVILM